jgi:dCMP deaminase
MALQSELDRVYMECAVSFSTLSKAQRAKVGCVVVKEGAIISDGVNGTPAGFANECEYTDFLGFDYTKPEVLHAEKNAISKLAASTQSSENATVYITLAPCVDCATLIIQAKIKRVVYNKAYHSDGIALLKKAGVKVEQFHSNKQRVPIPQTA